MSNENTGWSKEAKEARNSYRRENKRPLTEEQKQKQREYYKQWRANNRDKVKKNNENYWLRKAKKMQGDES